MKKFLKYYNYLRETLQQDTSYTVMVIPDNGDEIRRKNFDVIFLKRFCYAIGVFFTVLLSSFSLMYYVIYIGSVEKMELEEYRSTKKAQAEKLQELAVMAEALQKNMAKLNQLEEQVRTQMKKNGMEVPEKVASDENNASQYGGKGGGKNADVSKMLTVYAQNENLMKSMRVKTQEWENLAESITSESYRLEMTPNYWPLEGGYVSSDYGNRVNPFDKSSPDYHPGIDIADNYGAPIYASASGMVDMAGWYGGYGKYVKISHDYGFETAYGHMSGIVVSAGEYVHKGDLIGYVGSTGYSTGPHLHFEVLRYGESIDPRALMK